MDTGLTLPRKGVPMTQAVAVVRAGALTPETETVPLTKALGRVLAQPVTASRDQPPFRASAMDGYALRRDSLPAMVEQVSLRVIGESSAGRRFKGPVALGEAVRIFTGAPVPDDCDLVVIQENTRARKGFIDILTPRASGGSEPLNDNIRPAGQDFRQGDVLLEAGVRLDAWRLSLVAAAGFPAVEVACRPRLCVMCTGDELVLPGNDPNTDQIYESASHALMALIRQWGAKADYVGVKGDSEKAIAKALKSIDADMIVTVGGASVGDYDLVRPALRRLGLELAFESLSLRPGKPTAFGFLDDGTASLSLPGNPASAFVVAQLLLKPWIEASLGMPASSPFVRAVLETAVGPAGPRETYLRAKLNCSEHGQLRVTAFSEQDSSLVGVFARADALLRLPANAPVQGAGTVVDVVPLDRF